MLGLVVLFTRIELHGPGAISYAGKNVLEAVANRRIANGWGIYTAKLDKTLLATEDCSLMGRKVWLVVDGDFVGGSVVDCEADVHRGIMKQRGLLVDTNRADLVHKIAWMIIIR